jgi:hypothetical protein
VTARITPARLRELAADVRPVEGGLDDAGVGCTEGGEGDAPPAWTAEAAAERHDPSFDEPEPDSNRDDERHPRDVDDGSMRALVLSREPHSGPGYVLGMVAEMGCGVNDAGCFTHSANEESVTVSAELSREFARLIRVRQAPSSPCSCPSRHFIGCAQRDVYPDALGPVVDYRNLDALRLHLAVIADAALLSPGVAVLLERHACAVWGVGWRK